MSHHNGEESDVGGILVLGNGCVLVESKGLRLWEAWQLLDVLDIAVVFGVLWSVVEARWRECVTIVCMGFLTIDVLEDCGHQHSVSGVCHLSSVVALTSQVVQCIEWDFVGVFVNEDL